MWGLDDNALRGNSTGESTDADCYSYSPAGEKISSDIAFIEEFLDNRDLRCVSRGMVPLGNCQINVLLCDNSNRESMETEDYPYDLAGGGISCYV